jgi:hypothetical protein
MAFNGSGTFTRLYSWVTDAGNSLKIRSDRMDADSNDIASGLSNCITKDGQQTITANIPFNNKKITGLGAGTAGTDAAQLSQVQAQTTGYSAAAGTNTITFTMTPTLTALTDGMVIRFKAAATNTGAVTVNPDSLGALSVTLSDGTALAGGEIFSGGEYQIQYKASSTVWHLLDPTPADGSFIVRNSTDTTKKLALLLSSITTATTRTVTAPDASGVMVLDTNTQTLSAKTLTSPTINGGTLSSAVTGATAATHDNSTAVATNAYADRAGYQIEVNSQSANYTTVLADKGKTIWHPTADNNPRTFTIDSNANVAYPTGTCITFINEINTVTIAITSDTLVLAGSGSTGSRTLAANGVATAVKVSATRWYINGTGLT